MWKEQQKEGKGFFHVAIKEEYYNCCCTAKTVALKQRHVYWYLVQRLIDTSWGNRMLVGRGLVWRWGLRRWGSACCLTTLSPFLLVSIPPHPYHPPAVSCPGTVSQCEVMQSYMGTVSQQRGLSMVQLATELQLRSVSCSHCKSYAATA